LVAPKSGEQKFSGSETKPSPLIPLSMGRGEGETAKLNESPKWNFQLVLLLSRA
jgi:hypothetical protein